MSDPSGDTGNDSDQRAVWERFYREQQRPWRGIGKLGGLDACKGARALDLGCGNGKTVSALIQAGADVTGIDFSDSAVEYCQEKFSGSARFAVADCTSLPFPDRSFDIVTAVHIFEHLDDVQLLKTVSEVRRVLVPGGVILVRSFAVGDMRSDGKDSNVRGNGISYRYYTVAQMESVFDGFETVSSERTDETMRFGAVRVKVECIFRLPDGI